MKVLFAVIVALAAASACTNPGCDSETSDLLQVTKKAELKTEKKESIKESISDPLKFRVVPVNEDRDFFFKLRPRKIALAMPGGGARAMSGTTGQYRALNSMGLLKEVDEVVAVSGSTAAAIILAYAKGFTVEELVGEETFGSLSSLDLAYLANAKGEILKRVVSPTSPYVAVAANPFFGLPANKIQEVALAGNWLCPFGLNGQIPAFNAGPFAPLGLCANNNKNQIWTSSEERLHWIQKRNPQLDLSDALVMNGILKSIAIMGVLLSPVGYAPTNESVVALRFGPDFSGTPFYANEKTIDFEPVHAELPPLNNVVVGGGLVENFAFMATPPPENQGGRRLGFTEAELGPEGIVSLQEAMGISQATLALTGVTSPIFTQGVINAVAQSGGQDFTEDFAEDPYLFTPQRNYWPVADNKGLQGDIEEKKYYTGDGVIIESSGLASALRGGAECIVVSAHSSTPLPDPGTYDLCNDPPADPMDLLDFPRGDRASLYEYFGVARSGVLLATTYGYEYSNNQVFDKSELLPLLCEAQELLAAGKAVVVSRTYTTLENKFWGIDAGHHVNVVFVWTELSTDWVNELPAETQQSLANGDFDSPSNIVGDWPFPFLLSLNGAPDGQDFTALSPGQANLYASLTEWTLRQSEDKLRSCMGK